MYDDTRVQPLELISEEESPSSKFKVINQLFSCVRASVNIKTPPTRGTRFQVESRKKLIIKSREQDRGDNNNTKYNSAFFYLTSVPSIGRKEQSIGVGAKLLLILIPILILILILILIKATTLFLSNMVRSIIFITLLSAPVFARKAIGGSGGLLSSGSSGQSAGFGQQAANDPLKLVDIGDNTKRGWFVPPLDAEELVQKLGKEHRDVAEYISNTLAKNPLSIKLNKKRVGMKQQSFASPDAAFSNQEKYRAQVLPVSKTKQSMFKNSKLRSVWYIASGRAVSQTNAARQKSDDLLTKSYDENISTFHPSHFVLEVFLPKSRACKGGNPLVTYSIPMGAGTTSPKSRVSQSNGVVSVFPNGRKRKEGETSECIEVGTTSLHLNSGSPLVDPGWARGRKYFWKGRHVGQV